MEQQQQHVDTHAPVAVAEQPTDNMSNNSISNSQASLTRLHQYPPPTTTPSRQSPLLPSSTSTPSTPPLGQRTASTFSAERPRSIVEVAVNTGTTNPAGRQVRIQWLNEARARWDSLPRTSVIYLSYKTVMTLAKLIITIVLLVKTPDHQDCSLLGLMMILYALHAAIDYPFAIMRQLQPIHLGQPLTPQQRLMIHEKSLMEVLGTCLFFVSNYFMFQSSYCRRDVPTLFYGLLSFVIVDYIGILIPLVLCLAAIFCMPFLIRILTNLDIALGLAGPTGATEDLINRIPVVKYKKPVSASAGVGTGTTATAVMAGTSATSVAQGQQPLAGASTVDSVPSPSPALSRQNDTVITVDSDQPLSDNSLAETPSPTTSAAGGKQKQKTRRLGFGFRRKGGKGGAGGVGSSSSSISPQEEEYLTLEDEQDATCSICLCEYEDDEELRKMPCLHYFHKACVDEWLKLHKSCPLCKREIDEGVDERGRSRRPPPAQEPPTI